MSQLIQMRQRIKAIETIEKITHAMRLISMSLHARLKSKEAPLALYKDTINNLFSTIKLQAPTWENPILYPPATLPSKPLIILVGSNKGLCGNFNTALFKLFEMHKPGMLNLHYIAVGKKAIEYAKDKEIGIQVASYSVISAATISSLAHEITAHSMAGHQYTQVIFFSNMLKSFFIQRPRMTILIPFIQSATPAHVPEYIWEQSPEEILDMLTPQCIQANIHYILFESLIAEQAARFISMDNSTRSAKNLLDETQLLYNKLRQAKITKELIELTGSF